MRLLSVLVLTASVFGTGCASAGSTTVPSATAGGIRFTFANPDAGTVALAGSFNQWSVSSHPMTRTGSAGMWTIVVPLSPGEHMFMYVMNGTQWISPPFAEDYIDDGFGTRNGIVVVRPDER